ncbi:uncharacterized protein LOC130901354 [Diorhabda carinulata]|uniref:uncharacterized protein LOC130901354 n=1 Tax=Diorhabda carinulata TaxID=1163345 RepID=UPI0025A2D300|nr:uncharacterized protein LOC130901354 [Diorhabda carinulata]
MKIYLLFLLWGSTSARDNSINQSIGNLLDLMKKSASVQDVTLTSEIANQITRNVTQYINKTKTTIRSIPSPTTNDEDSFDAAQIRGPELTESELFSNETIPVRRKISETILSILDNYKQSDVIGVPGLPVPDPMYIPDMTRTFSIGTMYFENIQLHGLSKYGIEYVVANVAEMKVEVGLTIDVLIVTGNYTLKSWVSKGSGPFTVTMKNVTVIIITSLEVGDDGLLEAPKLDTDVTFGDIEMDFQELGFVANVFQGIMKSVGFFLFDSIKPYILNEVNTNIRHNINYEIKNINKTFLTTISPIDQLIYEIRKMIRYSGYEPFSIPDYNITVGIFDVRLYNTRIFGLSNFHRTKDLMFELRNKTSHVSFEVSTGKLIGNSNWGVVLIPGKLYRDGALAFTVNSFKVRIDASQSMDISYPPSLDDIQLELGDIHVKFNGLGRIDKLIEIGVNIIPNVLRAQIMDAIERPLKYKIQEGLNLVNVEKLVVDNADQLDDAMGYL